MLRGKYAVSLRYVHATRKEKTSKSSIRRHMQIRIGESPGNSKVILEYVF